jgi:hypothetical protein
MTDHDAEACAGGGSDDDRVKRALGAAQCVKANLSQFTSDMPNYKLAKHQLDCVIAILAGEPEPPPPMTDDAEAFAVTMRERNGGLS